MGVGEVDSPIRVMKPKIQNFSDELKNLPITFLRLLFLLKKRLGERNLPLPWAPGRI
jgi:hypothetical protein